MESRKQKIKNKKELKKFLGGQLCSTECTRTDKSKQLKGSMREISREKIHKMSAVCGNGFERWFVLLLENENQPKMKKAKQMEREAIINFNKNKRYFYTGNISTHTSWLHTKYFHTNGLKKN